MKKSIIVAGIIIFGLVGSTGVAAAKTSWSLLSQNTADTDGDGLSNWKEINLYNTNPNVQNTLDGEKHIYISIKYQELRYYTGSYLMDDFLVSTGIPGKDTPTGEFKVLKKIPIMPYIGPDYYLPNTKWNLMFKPSYYVHGAYWHSNFGHKMSHGCVNVSYTDMKPLYDWADVGTSITILAGDFPSDLSFNLPSHNLILDNQTIYLIMNGKKHGFTSMAVFQGLGYVLTDVDRRSTAGLTEGYVLNDNTMPHVVGSWIINGRTVYYVAEEGLIPVPTWEIFLSNGLGAKWLRANARDLSKQTLDLMVFNDPRL